MREQVNKQVIVWREDFENIPLNTRFVEGWSDHEIIYTSSCPVLIESRGNFRLGVFVLYGDEIVFRLDSGMILSTQLIKRWAFLE